MSCTYIIPDLLNHFASLSMLSVTYFYREPRQTGLSIEGIFNTMKKCLTGRVEIREFYCDGKLSRFKNTLEARKSSNKINHITGDVNFLALGLKGKTILTIHDIGHYTTLKRSPVKRYIYKLFWMKYPLKRADVVTVISQFTKDNLLANFDVSEDKIRIVYDPVKPVFTFDRKERLNGKPTILHIGTSRHKNLDGLIEAAKGLDVHLDIVAAIDDDFKEKLSRYGISYSLFERLTDEELNDRYKACDMLYFASFYEGFGMPIIEAQSVGRPVITSDLGAMKEVAAGSAVLVDPHDISAITRSINSLINDRAVYDKFVELGRKNAAKYDCNKIADDYLTVYKEFENK